MRTLILIAVLVLLLATPTVGAAVPADPFKAGTGTFYHYVRATATYPATLYSSITAKINNNFYTDRGASNIEIYGPYKASADFRGLPAIDFFDAQVGTGTVQDFRDLVAAAHAKGITVTIYMALLNVHSTNPVEYDCLGRPIAEEQAATTRVVHSVRADGLVTLMLDRLADRQGGMT